MIDFDEIKKKFTNRLRSNPSYYEFMLKEYFHYRMLDIIFSGEYASKMSFIGGTNLRILYHVQRFSEDLDFDCFNLSREEFMSLTNKVIERLRLEGIQTDFEKKSRDFEKLIFDPDETKKVLLFRDYILQKLNISSKA